VVDVTEETTADGRVVRGERNRQAIADALLAFYDAGEFRPSASQIAARAGISVRSVHNHFADMESLRAEVGERQWTRFAKFAELPPVEMALDERVGVIIERRSTLYEAITPVRRAALLMVHESPAVAKGLDRLNRVLRGQLEQLFAAELASRPAEVLDALDLCLSWDAWDRLRAKQRHSVAVARRVLTSTVRALLTTEGVQSR
jgi:TetR/AcrR family transcriptional regulator, regulator of autoinduction and epiphytic fitness